jgi:hypothetical protein
MSVVDRLRLPARPRRCEVPVPLCTAAFMLRFQLVIDCADPDRLARFRAAALAYEPPPAGFPSWDEYYRDLGGQGGSEHWGRQHRRPAWPGTAHLVPAGEGKTIENRLHLDVLVGGDLPVPLEIRAERVGAEARRLAGLGATVVAALAEPGLNHYAVAMLDPEGDKFDFT